MPLQAALAGTRRRPGKVKTSARNNTSHVGRHGRMAAQVVQQWQSLALARYSTSGWWHLSGWCRSTAAGWHRGDRVGHLIFLPTVCQCLRACATTPWSPEHLGVRLQQSRRVDGPAREDAPKTMAKQRRRGPVHISGLFNRPQAQEQEKGLRPVSGNEGSAQARSMG